MLSTGTELASVPKCAQRGVKSVIRRLVAHKVCNPSYVYGRHASWRPRWRAEYQSVQPRPCPYQPDDPKGSLVRQKMYLKTFKIVIYHDFAGF